MVISIIINRFIPTILKSLQLLKVYKNMEEIKGINIPKLSFKPQKLGDFLAHDGPLLSLFADTDNPDIYYFYKWTDSDSEVNRWLVFQVNLSILKKFLLQEVSLKGLLMQNPFVFLVDLDNDINEKQILIAATNDLPISYLPSEKSFFKEDAFTEFATEFKKTISQNKMYDLLTQIKQEISVMKEQQNSTTSILNTLLKKRIRPTT